MLTPKTNSLTCWPKGVSRVMSGIIFFVCSTSWISRCSLAATSVIYFLIRSESRVPPWQRKDKKRHLVKVHRWQNQSQRVRRWRSRDPWILCCTTRWMRGRTLRKISAIPSIRRMPKKNKSVFKLVSGNWCGIQADRVFSSEATGKHSNYTPWNQEDRDESSGSSARKLVREVNTKKEFHNMKITDHQNGLIWGLFMSSSMKAAVHLGPNYTENLEVYKRHDTSRKFRIYSISHRDWYRNILKGFWMWKRLKVHLLHGRDRQCLMTKWFSGQSRSTCLLRLRTVSGEDVTSSRSNSKMGRSSGRI